MIPGSRGNTLKYTRNNAEDIFRVIQRTVPRSSAQQGFTLLETLIYAALLAMTIGLTLGAVWQLMEGSGDLRAKLTTEEEANFLLRKITWALTGVSAINSPAPGATSSSLSVDKLSYAQNPVVIDSIASSARIAKGGGAAASLNSTRVSISNLEFQHIAASGTAPAAIRAGFSVDANSYQTTIHLRK